MNHDCYECGGTITGTPVTDEGDHEWLPARLHRQWCSQDCHDASAEADALHRWSV